MIPPGSNGSLIKFRFETIAVVTLALPFLSLALCVFLSLYYEFERSVSTHCKVANYLPSLSSSIGGFTPQRYIWRSGVAFHSAPRILVALMYLNFFRSFPSISSSSLLSRAATCNCVFNLMELGALVMLTYVSSTENYGIHESMFICFMVFSIAYMLMSLYLFRHLLRSHPADYDLRRSFVLKSRLFLFNVGCFAVSIYFFFRHNTYCEPGVYTLFSLCEYLVVFSNIAFHGTAYYDFKDYQLVARPNQDDPFSAEYKISA